MPFTFAHPAIVIPLRKCGIQLSLTGLIVGSMVPDFEFFIRMRVTENLGHHVSGFFLFDIPVALVLCYLFHKVVRNPLLTCLPTWYLKRLMCYASFDWQLYASNNKASVFLAIIIGIASHLFWDGFTHYNGFFVQLFSSLQLNINIFGYQLAIYTALQVLSSIWGMAMVQYYIASMPITAKWQQTNFSNNSYPFWMILIISSTMILMVRLFVLNKDLTFWDIFMACMGSGFFGLIITSLVFSRLNTVSWQEL